jgi:hypothetical protein
VPYVTTWCREVHHVQGVPLHDVLTRVELRRDERCKVDHLNFVVLAFAGDGYRFPRVKPTTAAPVPLPPRPPIFVVALP